jgi:hypothetical protein
MECKELLKVVPLYNNEEDDLFPPNMPFCDNPECSRYGLLTVLFGSKEEDEQDEHKEV